MESDSTKLGQFLQSLCIDSPWSYAIFWKLHQQNMFLTCEDGYYDYSKLQESFQSILDDDYTRQENVSDSILVANLSSVQYATYPIHVAIADMSCHQYELGEGLIGIVASSGRYLWIDVDEVKSSEIMSTLKYPDEWLLAMAAGIKTTLLTPVMPHGVLQLGSLKKVVENQATVANIKDMFITIQRVNYAPSFTSNENAFLYSSNRILDKDETSIASSTFYKRLEHEDSEENLNVETTEDEFSFGSQVLLPSATENYLPLQDVTTIYPYKYDADLSNIYMDLDSEIIALSKFDIDELFEITNDLGTNSYQERCYNDYLYPEETQVVPTNDTNYGANHINLENFDEFTKRYEIGEVLEEDFEIKNQRDSNISNEQNMNVGQEGDQEHLFEALITELLCDNFDDNVSHSYNSYRSSLTSLIESSPFQMQFSCDATTSLSINETMVTKACATQSLDESIVATSLTSSPSFESLVGAHVKDKNVVECAHGLSNSKCAKETKVNKRKTKAKSGHRQRPRDRQLIQNRLKELRELVPNVEQCSIDGLLEQTIKHMTFLKSVNQHAEKLKQFNDKVIADKEKNTTRHCCATSSTLKVVQNHGSYPVIVKDLEHPGQLLIQMLCNNEAIFFEMAEVIHQLKLTILKGVMETCCSNWAHFVVQASIGFNRLDIFWPLMKILQRNGNWTMNQWNP